MARTAKSTPIYNSRNLLTQPIGKANKKVLASYNTSVTPKSDVISWGYDSTLDRHLRMFNRLQAGDVVAFVYEEKVSILGIVQKTYQDPEAYKTIGWRDGSRFDLIVEMKRVDLAIPDYLSLVKYRGVINSSSITVKKKAEVFWSAYEQFLPLDPSCLQATARVTFGPLTKTPAEDFTDDARTLTEVSWHQHKGSIDPLNLGRNKKWHLDHRFSIAAAFAIGMPSWLVADPVNLHMMPGPENMSKNSKCGSIDPIIEKHPEYAYLKDKYLQMLADGTATWTR